MIFVRLCKYGGGWSSIIRLISNFPENISDIKKECIDITLQNNLNLIRMYKLLMKRFLKFLSVKQYKLVQT